MRWRDEFIALLGVVSGFGAVVLWAEGVSVLGVLPLIVLAALALVVSLWRWGRTPRVLLVADAPGRDGYELRSAMDEAGFAVRTCPGPDAHRPCPVHLGQGCPYGEPAVWRPVAAVIRHRAGDDALPCGRALRVPFVLVEDGEVPTTIGNGRAAVAATRPEDAAEAARSLVALRREALRGG